MFSIIGIVVVFGAVIAGLLDGAWKYKRSDAARRTGHHSGRGDRDRAGCEPASHSEEDRQGLVGAFTGSAFTKQRYAREVGELVATVFAGRVTD